MRKLILNSKWTVLFAGFALLAFGGLQGKVFSQGWVGIDQQGTKVDRDAASFARGGVSGVTPVAYQQRSTRPVDPRATANPRRVAMRQSDGEISWNPEEEMNFELPDSTIDAGTISFDQLPDSAGADSTSQGATPLPTEPAPQQGEVLPDSVVNRGNEVKTEKLFTPKPRELPTRNVAEDGASMNVPEKSANPNPSLQNESTSKFDELTATLDETSIPQTSTPTKKADEYSSMKDRGPKLPQATTRIDRFGNIGQLWNGYGTSLTEDGRLVGNPYASGFFDFHPRYFPVGPETQVNPRAALPYESFGEDGYGNYSGYGCGCCYDGCYDGCYGGCYDECGGGCYGECEGGCYGDGCCVDNCYRRCCLGALGCLWSRLVPLLRSSEISAGVFTYQDAFDASNDASFGADLGFNWGMPCRILGLNAQAGLRYLRGGKERWFFREEERRLSQFFGTMGLFYREPGERLQFGAVYDTLRDETIGKYDLNQVRTELSFRCSELTTIGFRGAFHLKKETWEPVLLGERFQLDLSAQDYYTGFISHTFVTGAEGTIGAGVTKDNEGLLNAGLEVPVTNHSSLRNNFTYIFPRGKDRRENDQDDSWSASISWVVYLGGSSRRGMIDRFKPLFNVADNTTFLQRVD